MGVQIFPMWCFLLHHPNSLIVRNWSNYLDTNCKNQAWESLGSSLNSGFLLRSFLYRSVQKFTFSGIFTKSHSRPWKMCLNTDSVSLRGLYWCISVSCPMSLCVGANSISISWALELIFVEHFTYDFHFISGGTSNRNSYGKAICK